MSIIIDVLRKDVIQSTAIVLTTVAYAVVVNRFLIRIKDRKDKEEKKFLGILENAIKNGLISEFSDVEDIYKGIKNVSGSGDELNRVRLAKWLRIFLLNIYENESSSENAIKLKQSIKNFVEAAETISPHSELPSLERSLIRDIEKYLIAADFENSQRKLKEIVTSIIIREESVMRLKGIAKWSIPLSVIGLILTVTFGILSLI